MVDLIDFIQGTGDPILFLILVFIYSVLVAIILPIPIEIILFGPGSTGDYLVYLRVALVMAAGKAVGAWMIFILGTKVEDNIRRWSAKYPFFERFVQWCIRFVRKTRYTGLFILLSIPGMTDTVPIYIYSLFNEEGEVLDKRMFVGVNFAAGLVRAALMLAIFLAFGFWLG
jgi:membrane protein YqaA with SNARE-associated domain